MKKFTVVGAGLAGCEAAWQIAQAGYRVTLVEMKPVKFSPAHKSENFAELVCSNSLKASRIDSAAGLLKEEMARLGSLTVPVARNTATCAPSLLAAFTYLSTAFLVTNTLDTTTDFPDLNAAIASLKHCLAA